LQKTVSDNNPNVGDTIRFYLVVTNQGPDDATNVAVQDLVPNGYTNIHNANQNGQINSSVVQWSNLNINANMNIRLSFDVVVLSSGDYLNTAEITSSDQYDPDSTPDNDDGDQSEDDEDSATINAQEADLELEKTVSNSTPLVGEVVTFTLSLENKGPDAATGVSVQDVVPSGYNNITNINNNGVVSGSTIDWNNLSVQVGEIILLTFDVEVLAVGDHLNSAQITDSDQYDLDSTPNNDDGDQSEDDEDSEPVTPQIDPNITLEKVADDTQVEYPVQIGNIVTYSFKICNTGNVILTNVQVTDPIVTVVGQPIDELGVGECDDVSFTGTYSITQDDIDVLRVENSALVTGTDPTGEDVDDLSDDPNDLTDVDPDGDGDPDDPTVVNLAVCEIETSLPDDIFICIEGGAIPFTDDLPVEKGLNETVIVPTTSNGDAPYTYQWSSGETTESITVEPDMTTTYIVTVTDRFGCQAIDSMTVEIFQKPFLYIDAQHITCDGQGGTIRIVGPIDFDFNSLKYTVENDMPYNVEASGTLNELLFTNVVEGNYIISFRTRIGDCLVSVEPVDIIDASNNVFNVDLGEDMVVCSSGGGVSLKEDPTKLKNNMVISPTVTGGTMPFTYLWSTGETSPSIIVSPNVTTTYTVTVTDAYGCESIDSKTVEIFDIPFIIGDVTNIQCDGTGGMIEYLAPAGFDFSLLSYTINGVNYPGRIGQESNILIIENLPIGVYQIEFSLMNDNCPFTVAPSEVIDVSLIDRDDDGITNCLDPDDSDPCFPNDCSNIFCDVFDLEDFEDNVSIWNDGGVDVIKSTSHASSGLYSMRLRDNSGIQSSIYTNPIFTENLAQIRVNFSFLAISMEHSEDFMLEISHDNGATYTVVKQWVSGIDFFNNTRYQRSVSIPLNMEQFSILRFRSDASSNADNIFLDDIVVELCNSGGGVSFTKDEGTLIKEFEIDHDDLKLDSSFEHYPSIVDDILFVKHSTDLFLDRDIRMQVYSIHGALMIDKRMSQDEVMTINTSRLPSGQQYILRITNPNEQVEIKKFIKR